MNILIIFIGKLGFFKSNQKVRKTGWTTQCFFLIAHRFWLIRCSEPIVHFIVKTSQSAFTFIFDLYFFCFLCDQYQNSLEEREADTERSVRLSL